MLSLESRSTGNEIMDDLDCDGAVVFQTLRELEFINKYLGGNSVTVSGVARLLKDISVKEKLSVVDLGCGSGDVLKHIYRWGVKHNFQFSLIGIDANPNIISYAATHADSL